MSAAFVAAGLGALVSWQLGLGARSASDLAPASAGRLSDSPRSVAAAPPRRVMPAVAPPVVRFEESVAENLGASEEPETLPERLPAISPEVVVYDRGPVPSLLEPETFDSADLAALSIAADPQRPARAPASATIAKVPEPEPPAGALFEPEMAPPEGRTLVVPAARLDVFVTQTVWHPDPERRSAVVEVGGSTVPLEVHEGDRVGELLLVRIKPSSVIFERDGVEIKRRVGARP